jgi:hypothetical protein
MGRSIQNLNELLDDIPDYIHHSVQEAVHEEVSRAVRDILAAYSSSILDIRAATRDLREREQAATKSSHEIRGFVNSFRRFFGRGGRRNGGGRP